MRLLAFCDYYSPRSCGGAERVAREVYSRLASDYGVEVTVIGTGPAALGPGVDDRANCRSIHEAFVPGRDLSPLVGAQLTVSRGLGAAADELVRTVKPTVLHANSLHFHSSVVAARIARATAVPLVTTAHLGAINLLPLRMRVPAMVWDHTVGRRIVNASARVVAVSESVSAHVQRLGVDPERLSVAYNGVDHETFHAEDRRGVCGPLRVGFVGRLIANKGPQILLEALARLRRSGVDVEAVFVGGGPMRTQLEAKVEALGLRRCVRFTGQVDDVATRMRDLDVVVRPSYTEGLPLGVIEAMACGAVVVCSNVPGNLELVDDRGSGLVFPVGDASALANAIGRLASDLDLLAGLREKALARAADLTWDACAAAHFEALESASALGSRR